jgi:hypothetical protein
MRAVACWLLLGSVLPAQQPTIDPVWLERARTEGKAAYAKYAGLVERLEESSEIRSDKASGTPEGEIPFSLGTRRDRVVRLGDNAIIEMTRTFDDKTIATQIRLECDNADYNFALAKSREDGPYALHNYQLGARKLPLIERGGVGVHTIAYGELLPALKAAEGDQAMRLNGLHLDEPSGLLIFDFAHTAKDNPAERKVWIDPRQGWRVVEAHVSTPSLTGVTRATYGTEIEGVSFPVRTDHQVTYKVAKAPPNLVITSRVLDIKLTTKTPADFRLAAFGFDEPGEVAPQPKPTPWYFWLLVAAGVSGALALGFTLLRRRAATPGGEKP